ncbi:MAG: rhomboid family intramembrane serine protease [Armatimonadota bacterium]
MAAKDLKRYVEELQQVPFVTIGIILINCLATYLARRDMSYYETYVLVYGLVPDQFRVGRLLSSTFIHDGYAHLALNMSMLYVFGREVERVMGRLEYVMFYIGACFAASLLHVVIALYAMMPAYYASRAMVGASGAVAGVMGIYAVRFHRRVFRFGGVEIPALLLIMAWLILQLALGIIGLYRDQILGIGLKQIGYWSHLGGFGFGIVVALAANMALPGEREYLVEQARRHDSEGNLLQAIANHEALLKYDPDNAESHAEIARLWALLDEKEDSLRSYHVAIELLISQGKEEQALQLADEMAGFWPSSRLSAATRFRLATYLEETGQTAPAIEAFERIARDEPDSAEAQMSLLKIGHLQLSAIGDARAAAETLSGFLERYPCSEWRTFATDLLRRAKQAAA